MKMKKNVLGFVLIVGIAVSLSSCMTSKAIKNMIPSTHKLVVDKNVSADQNVLVTFVNNQINGSFSLILWNNKDITDELYGKKGNKSNDKARLNVPAGRTSFTFDAHYTTGSRNMGYTTYTYSNIELRYNLESGKEYQIKGKVKSLGFLKGYERFVGIYDVTGRSTLLKEWSLSEIFK